MARPQKHTVDYFSHDADASEGRTITILENNFGVEGYAAWFKLLERLSKAENHVLTCRNTEDTEFLAAKLNLKPEKTKEFLSKLAELDAIDADLFKNGVVWCQHFVDRLKDVYTNRRQPLPQKPIFDVSTGRLQPITELSSVETELLTPEIPQSKVKETKGNNSKEYSNNFDDSLKEIYQGVGE